MSSGKRAAEQTDWELRAGGSRGALTTKRARHTGPDSQLALQRERESEADQVALQLLRTYLGGLLDPVSGQGVRVVSEWTRYPPFPQYDPAETFEWLVDRVLFSPLSLELSYDGIQLFEQAPTLRLPMQVAQSTDTNRRLLALLLEQNRRLFSSLERTGVGDQVTLRGLRFDPLDCGLEECVPREKLLIDVLHRWLIGAHHSAAHGGASYTCIMLQMRLALDRLHCRKRMQGRLAGQAAAQETEATAVMRARQLPKLCMLMNLLRRPGLYDITRASYLALYRDGPVLRLAHERGPSTPMISSSSSALVPVGSRAMAPGPRAPPPPFASSSAPDPMRRLRDMTRLLRTVAPTARRGLPP